MIPIAIAFAVSIAFTLERFIRLFFQYNVDGASFMFEVQKHILANDLDGAIRVCNGANKAALPKILKSISWLKQSEDWNPRGLILRRVSTAASMSLQPTNLLSQSGESISTNSRLSWTGVVPFSTRLTVAIET